MENGAVPVGGATAPYDFTLHDGPAGTTRLIVRERDHYSRRWAALMVQPAELVSCLMSPRMLRGIARRAEHFQQHGADVSGTQLLVEKGIPA